MKRGYLKHLGFTTSVALLTANKSTMDKDTQLPAEVVEEIKLKAEGYATITAHIPKGKPISHHDAHVWCRLDYEAGAIEYATKWFRTFEENGRLASKIADYVEKEKEYATKLQQAEQERERLNGELDTAIRANENLTSRMQGWQQQLYGVQKECDTARTLLQKFISRHEGALIITDPELYNEIKTFLDGK